MPWPLPEDPHENTTGHARLATDPANTDSVHRTIAMWANRSNLQGLSGQDQAVRYVSKAGSDSNDGKSWGTAKLTVAGAFASLPQVADGAGNNTGRGIVRVGRGTFVESSTPILLAGGVMIEGTGNGTSGMGTHITLANSKDNYIFETKNTGAQNHGLVFKDLDLGGNKANQGSTADSGCIKLAGGYNVYLLNVSLKQAARWGIHVVGGYMNIQMLNITGASCGSTTQGGWIFLDQVTGGVCTIEGAQVDQCGVYPLLIQHTGSGLGSQLAFRDMKFENQGTAAQHESAIRFKPRASAGGQPVNITVENSFFQNNVATTDQHVAAIFEETASGVGARWAIKHCVAFDQYQKLFNSAKSGRTSQGRHVRFFLEHNNESFAQPPPAVEVDGVRWNVSSGTPEGNVTAPVGSLYSRRDGGNDTALYVKGTGTGNTGWRAVTTAAP